MHVGPARMERCCPRTLGRLLVETKFPLRDVNAFRFTFHQGTPPTITRVGMLVWKIWNPQEQMLLAMRNARRTFIDNSISYKITIALATLITLGLRSTVKHILQAGMHPSKRISRRWWPIISERSQEIRLPSHWGYSTWSIKWLRWWTKDKPHVVRRRIPSLKKLSFP